MLDVSFGPVLLSRPDTLALDWSVVGVGLLLGYLWPRHSFAQRVLYQPFCVGAAIFAISRDFFIPLDAAVLACLPVCLVRWGGGDLLPYALVAAIIVSYFVLASDLSSVPANPWSAALAAFAFVARAPAAPASKLVRVGLVVAWYRVPRAAHALYGSLLFVLEPTPTSQINVALAFTLCVLLATQAWYAWLATVFGAASLVLLPRRFTI